MRPLLDQAAPPVGDDDGVFVQRLEDQAELPDEVVLRNEEWRRLARPRRDAWGGYHVQPGSLKRPSCPVRLQWRRHDRDRSEAVSGRNLGDRCRVLGGARRPPVEKKRAGLDAEYARR